MTGPDHEAFGKPPATADTPGRAQRVRARLDGRAVVLVGMMGSGKSSVGKRLAAHLDLPFVDADTEIETAAGMSIPDFFATHGEAEFRAGEVRVIARLLERGGVVLATGGGAFMNATTREAIGRRGVSIFLDGEPEVLMRRVRKRANRPLLQTADPEATLRGLLEQRRPTYLLADIRVESRDVPHEAMVDEVAAALDAHLAATTGVAP